MQKRPGILVVTFALVAFVHLHAASAPKGMRVATEYDHGQSLTGGIQEAIESLPEAGGTVYVPEGAYVLRRPVKLKPNMKLVGAGRGTVLKKDPAFKLFLAEDAKRKQDYVVVKDAAKLKVGAAIAIGDRKHTAAIWGGMFLITKIEGRKVFIDHILGRGGLRTDLAVKDDACLMNLFMVILPARGCLIQDLELDGNASEQMIDEASKYAFTSYGMLWCGIYPCSQIKVTRLWVHDAGIGLHLNGTEVEVSHCRIYRNLADGIHTGGCPGAFITNNRIYDNGAGGISFCYGNRGLIITNNHLYGNEEGIKALGEGDRTRDTTADRYTIISHNVVYANKRAGICSGQGEIGPQDFVIEGNIVKDNQLARYRGLGRHCVPAGICLCNAQRCVIANNRCLDDQDAFPRALAQDAQVGDDTLRTVNSLVGLGTGQTTLREGRQILISDNARRELQLVEQTPTMNKGTYQIKLGGKLAHGYRAKEGAKAVGVKTQSWGLFVGGPLARDNVIANNVCTGNIVGGILWQGRDTAVAANVGKTVAMDGNLSLEQNVFRRVAVVRIPNPGFEEDTGWRLAKTAHFDTPGHTGKRSLKITKRAEKGVADATCEFFALKPNALYRLSAWVRSNAKKGNRLVLPYLFLYSKDWKPLGGRTNPLRSFGPWPPPFEPLTWVQVSAEAQTGPKPVEARIYCRFEGGIGDVWFDDVMLEELPWLPSPTAGASVRGQ